MAVAQATFAQVLAASLGRRVWLCMLGLPLRGVLGDMSTLLLDGQNALPDAAMGHGFRFAHARLGGALAQLVDSEKAEEGLVRKEH